MIPFRALLLAGLIVAAPAVATAQSRTGTATLVVKRGLSIATVSPMRLPPYGRGAGLSVTGANLIDAPAMIRISGDPGRIYRIRLPQDDADEGVAVVEDLKIWSATSGDISETRVARLDPQGHDMLRVSGRLRVWLYGEGDLVATLPLSIDYE
jgi:hypothetical protein